MSLDQVTVLLEKAETLGVFDASWYSQKYGLGFENKFDCFTDYLRKSRHSWVDPSPSFSTKAYFKAHFGSLLNSGISPLEHFLGNESGSNSFLGSSKHWHPSRSLNPSVPFQASISCAVTAHIFYYDYIHRFIECLHYFPTVIDVYLAISDSEFIDQAYNLLSEVDCVNNICIRVAPNKGRNFGPLLVEFGAALLDYDVFCHVHSKKSLFSGSSQEIWGDYLFEYLLRDKQILSKALALFECPDNYGVYFPTAYTRSLPKWASHTLKNKHTSNELCKLLSLPPPEHGFLSYPVGGMFWAKSEALRPLLSHPWTYDDFPAEPIANDGTILHAMERMLVHISNTQGFREFVYHPSSGLFTTERKHIQEEYINSRGDIGYIVQHSPAKIISFDIFDTLVYRVNSFPDQGKEDMAKHLGYAEPSEFTLLRNQTEYQLREESGFTGDVSILDIYGRLLSSIETNLSAQDLADLELQFDIANMLPKSIILTSLNDALKSGKFVYIASDTYYTKEQIRKLLDIFGVPANIRLFVSSDLRRRKDNGTMWEHIKQILTEEHIDPLNEFIHIGDNVVSDSQIPGDYGIGSYHILNPFEKWNFLAEHHLSESDLHDHQKRAKFGHLVGLIGAIPFIE